MSPYFHTRWYVDAAGRREGDARPRAACTSSPTKAEYEAAVQELAAALYNREWSLTRSWADAPPGERHRYLGDAAELIADCPALIASYTVRSTCPPHDPVGIVCRRCGTALPTF